MAEQHHRDHFLPTTCGPTATIQRHQQGLSSLNNGRRRSRAAGVCGRTGQYRKESLIAQFGPDIMLPDLRHDVSGIKKPAMPARCIISGWLINPPLRGRLP